MPYTVFTTKYAIGIETPRTLDKPEVPARGVLYIKTLRYPSIASFLKVSCESEMGASVVPQCQRLFR